MIGMQLGITLPQFGSDVDVAADLPRFAAAAEEAGAASLWVGDRLLAARAPTVGYAGSDTIPVPFRRVLDPFVVLGMAAAATSRVTLGASVLVGPLYPPAVLARSLATISAVGRGRLIAGLGIGWSPEEYAAAGVGFDHRGARLDDLLDGLDALWSADGAAHDGRHASTPAAYVEIPRPRLPRYLSAFSPAALDRVGRRADGWLPAVRLPGSSADVASWLLGCRATIDAAATAAGRDPAAVGTVLRVNVGATVPVGDVADALRGLVDATGFTDVFVDLMYRPGPPEQRLETFDRLLRAIR